MKINFAKLNDKLNDKTNSTECDALVVFLAHDKKQDRLSPIKLSPKLDGLVASGIDEVQFKGGRKETVFFRQAVNQDFKHVLFVGLGPVAELDGEALRVAAAVALQSLKAQKIKTAGFHLDSALKAWRDQSAVVQALVEGAELAVYDYSELKGHSKAKDKKTDKKSSAGRLETLSLLSSASPTVAMTKALLRAETLVECQNLARRLGDTPGNLMTPTILAEETQKAAKGTRLKVTVWDKKRLEKENFGGILAVNQGSSEPPKFIIMEYRGAPASKKPVCFVGKGLTFDTGGISIKPSASMEEMKYDMCGGAAVIGTLLALAKLKAKVNVIGLVPSTENMPGPAALKPGDVYFARNGKSVEVFNTDAEGRLILGDALVYASEQKPAAIFDAATLTGAILIALGNTHTGVFTRDGKLMKRIQEASDATGELVWGMPLLDFHVDDMKGTHADLCNISGGRLAGSSTAAAFLEEFVDREIPWAHFDIAGTAWNVNSRFPYCPKKGASGVMVRTFVELAESYFV